MMKHVIRQGTEVKVWKESKFDYKKTRTVIARHSSVSSTNSLMLEHNRKAHFLPEELVDNGYYIENFDSVYVISGMYNEVLRGKVVTKIAHLMECNCLFNIYREQLTIDEYGHKTSEYDEVYEEVYGSLEIIAGGIQHKGFGTHEENTYKIYVSNLDIKPLDRLTTLINDNILFLKVEYVDNSISFDGLNILRCVTDLR